MARLTDEEFRAWCQRNAIEPATEAYLQRIRSSEPVRKVRSGASNVSGRYPSVKMGFSIQFESQHVELWGIYTMERDDDVLEFYDQPTRIQLHYHARSGRKTSPWHTPDFLVLRKDGAGFEEWKPADALDKLVVRMPERYQRAASGGWRCPPGETTAQSLGLSYRVRTSAEYHPLYIQNLKFLQDFWTHSFHVEAEQEAQVLEALSAYPGVSVAALLDAHPHLSVDVVWAMLTSQRIFTREVDPKRLAVWTLERFASRLCEYVHEVYDQMDHPALGQSPREAFEQGMTLAGSRSHRLIAYSEDFLMQTRPTTRTGTVKIHPSRGITVNGLHYWHDSMRASQVAGQTVHVRYEPYDMGVAYAYIGGQWLECIADAFALVHGRSEREWDLILEEWREQQRQHGRKRITLNGPLLAQFLQQLENDEALLLQRQRDLEEQAQREVLLLKTPLGVLPREAPPLVEVDLTKIPQYEEYT